VVSSSAKANNAYFIHYVFWSDVFYWEKI
jgi:hypothetical protein